MGEPLTATTSFTDPDGTDWIAYVEGVAPNSLGLFGRRTVLPGRRLRFDAASTSRVASRLPAGAPFLAEARLLQLLAESVEVTPPVLEPARGGPERFRLLVSSWIGQAKAAWGAAWPVLRRAWETLRVSARRLRARAAREHHRVGRTRYRPAQAMANRMPRPRAASPIRRPHAHPVPLRPPRGAGHRVPPPKPVVPKARRVPAG